MILSGQFSCAQTAHFGIFSKGNFLQCRMCGTLTLSLPGPQQSGARTAAIGVFMDKSHFALSLGFAGLILATHAGWGVLAWPVAQAAPWPLPPLVQAGP